MKEGITLTAKMLKKGFDTSKFPVANPVDMIIIDKEYKKYIQELKANKWKT